MLVQGCLLLLGTCSATSDLKYFLVGMGLFNLRFALLCAVGMLAAIAGTLLWVSFTALRLTGAGDLPGFSVVCGRAVHMAKITLCLVPGWLVIDALVQELSRKSLPILFALPDKLLSVIFQSFFVLPLFAGAVLFPFLQHPLLLSLVDPQPVRRTFQTAKETWRSSYRFLLVRDLIGVALQIVFMILFHFVRVDVYRLTDFFVCAVTDTNLVDSFCFSAFACVLQSALLYIFLEQYAREKENGPTLSAEMQEEPCPGDGSGTE